MLFLYAARVYDNRLYELSRVCTSSFSFEVSLHHSTIIFISMQGDYNCGTENYHIGNGQRRCAPFPQSTNINACILYIPVVETVCQTLGYIVLLLPCSEGLHV